MVKYTPATLKKLEDTLKEYAYEVRYEKGNFRSGYCVLEAKKVVVVNKFSTLESRIQSLIEITQQLAKTGKITNPDSQNKEQPVADTDIVPEVSDISDIAVEGTDGPSDSAATE
jgi:hypothetical protein